MPELLAVVDDSPYFRRAVERTLGKVYEVRSFCLADDLLREMAAGESFFAAVLFDLDLEQGSGMSLLETLRSQPEGARRSKVIIITEHSDPLTVVTAMQHKPDGYLLKGDPAMPLLEAVKDALAGGLPIAMPVARALVDFVASIQDSKADPLADPPPSPVVLSRRELEVLELLDDEKLTNPAIAEVLGVSQSTLATHISHIYRKLEVRNRPDPRFEALAKARRLGLLNTVFLARPRRQPLYVVGQASNAR